jgi:hypothetical protein
MDMNGPTAPEDLGRRRFIATVGLAGLASSLGVGGVLAQTPAPAPAATPAAPAPATTPAAPTAPAGPSEDAYALAGIVRRRYGQHLKSGDLDEIAEELDYRIQNGKRLRGVKLANADEPDSIFRA